MTFIANQVMVVDLRSVASLMRDSAVKASAEGRQAEAESLFQRSLELLKKTSGADGEGL